MTPYQWIGSGPRFRTGSMLIVIKPRGRALAGPAVTLAASRDRVPLEDAIAALGADTFDAMAQAPQPRRQRVGAEMALDHKRCRGLRLEALDPREQQLVERRLAQPDRRVGVRARKANAVGNGFGIGGNH